MKIPLRHLLWLSFLALVLSCGSDAERGEQVESQRAALTSEDQRVLGCELASDWSSDNPNVTLASSEVREEGAASLQVGVPWQGEVFAHLTGPVGGAPEKFSLSLRLSQAVSSGEVKVVLRAPSVELWWGELQPVSLVGLAADEWHRLEFPLGSFAAQVAAATNLELRVTIAGPNGPVLLDALAFDGASGTGGAGGGSGGSGGSSGGSGGGSGAAPGDALVLRFPAGTSFDEVIFGTQGGNLDINDSSLLYEGNSTTVFAPASQLGLDAATTLGTHAATGSVFSQGDVWARSNAQIDGSVFTSGAYDAQEGVVVAGTVQPGLDLEPLGEVHIPYEFPPGTHPELAVLNGATETLAPGAYGAVTVHGQSTVEIGAGTYYFDEVTLNAGSTLRVDNAQGTVFVFIQDKFVRHSVVEYTAPDQFNVLYGVVGAGPVVMDGGPFRGILVAPQADIDLQPGPSVSVPHYFGAFFGKSIRAHQTTRYQHFPFRRTDCASLGDECSGAFGCMPSDCDGPCVSDPDGPGCHPGHCTNGVRDGNETDVDCGGSCPPCGSGDGCNSNVDCGTDLECGENNGGCFGRRRSQRVCWPVSCRVTNPDRECGEADSTCGSSCSCTTPCDTTDPDSTCPDGEVCREDMGLALEAGSRDACVDPTCPSNDPALCGTPTSLCGDTCVCTPDCSSATCGDPDDGCGGLCPGVCGPGDDGCTEDVECPSGYVCVARPDGINTCHPGSCVFRALAPPLCGGADAPCGACPECTAACDGRSCGPDPNCGQSCGTCASGQYCTASGQCRTPSDDPPIETPDGPVPDLPEPVTNPVGAVPGSFSVSEQGTAQYVVPIQVPPGRAGMEPALSLAYSGSKMEGDAGVGWQLSGLSKITRCPRTYALDGFSVPVEGKATDRYCIDGKRLEVVSGEYGADGSEYRTLIDSFSKVVAHRDSGSGLQHDVWAAVQRVSREAQGPDWFKVWTKDGRILTYGRTADSLVRARDGVRHTWLLNRVEDRAGNTIVVQYTNTQIHLPVYLAGALPSAVFPSKITYTGHEDTEGNREVRFTYDKIDEASVRFLQGGLPSYQAGRLARITTYVDGEAVKNYRLEYRDGDIKQIERVFECAGGDDTLCKPPTEFEYVEESGFSYGGQYGTDFASAGQLDVNGDGIPDFFGTKVTRGGVNAQPGLIAARIGADVVVAVGSSFLPLGVGIGVSVLWEAAKGPFFGLFAEKPKIEIDHLLRIGHGNRVDGFDALMVEGIKECGGAAATTLLDYDQDGYDDVIVMCPSLSGGLTNPATDLFLSLSNGDGTFDLIPDPLLTLPASPFTGNTPAFFDIDGDGLQDIASCAETGVLQVRRRRAPPFPGYYEPLVTAGTPYLEELPEPKIRFTAIPFCTEGRPTYNIFDVNGDGTPDLLARGPDGWAALRYSRSSSGDETVAWESVHFPDMRNSELGRGMSVADLNADGLPDVWKVDTKVPDEAIIWLNKGTGAFSPKKVHRPTIGGDFRHTRTAALDYDADGRLDLLEFWRTRDDAKRNVALLPSPGLESLQQVFADDLRRMITTPPATQPTLQYGPWLISGDIDGDSNADLFGEGVGVFYGSGARNTFLSRVTDGLGNVVTVSYQGGTLETPTYATDERCDGSAWPERCLKKMVGLVASHSEGFLSQGTTIIDRTYDYTYRNARMNVSGHGWLGFDERTVSETARIDGAMLPFGTVKTEYEPPARYAFNGQPSSSAAFRYLYPLAGLPKRVTVIQGPGASGVASPLEDGQWARKTVIENEWLVEMSASNRPFPRLERRYRSVYQKEVADVVPGPGPAPEGEERLQENCGDYFDTDSYGNVTRHVESCQTFVESVASRSVFDAEFVPDPSSWLISNPVSIIHERSERYEDTATSNREISQTRSWEYSYDSRGLVEAVERTTGASSSPPTPGSPAHRTLFQRDAVGNVRQVLDELPGSTESRLTAITYDVDEIFPATITNAKGHTVEMSFDQAWAKPTAVKDANDLVQQQSYDGFGRLAASYDPSGITTYEYAATAQAPVTTPVGLGHPRIEVTIQREGASGTRTGTSVQTLDYQGRPLMSSREGFSGVSVLQARAYDGRGRVVGETLPHAPGAAVIPTVHYSYDDLDRLIRADRSDGSFVEHAYARGVTLDSSHHDWISDLPCLYQAEATYCAPDIRLTTDETGRQNVTVMDHRGRVIRNIDGNNVANTQDTSDYWYAGFDLLFEARDNGGNVTRFDYDAYGRLTRHTDPDSGVSLYTYNGFDELVRSEDPSGQVRTYAYDELGRTVSVTDASGITQWIYDQGENALGRLSETIAPPTPENPFGQRERYTYEPGNRGLLSRLDAIIDGTEYPVTFTYDDLGRPDRIHYPNVTGGDPVVVEHTYSSSGILTGLDEVGSGTSRQLWRMEQAFQGHLLERETFGNGASTTYDYDPQRRWIDDIETTFGGSQVQALEYERYANGLISARHAAGRGLEEHTYDALNRLHTTTTTPVGGTAEQVTHTYDTLGNITHTGQYAVGYHGTRKHQVTTVGPNSYQYNTSGNVRERSGPDIPGGLQTIEYTPFDLPRTITSGDLVTHFEYTADETRVVRRDIDRTRHFVGDLYQRVISPTGDTLEERFRIQASGRLIGEIVRADGTERTLYAHTDHQGTVDTLTAGPGEVYVQPYSPWGSPEGSAGLDQTRAGYTGHQHDTDLGLVDMRGRIYDPLAARFMSPDPVMQAPFWSQGLNRYSYVFNDPVNNTDPTGFVTGNDAATTYAPFHIPATTTMAAVGSGLGIATGPLSIGSTLLGGGAGFAQAGGTYNAVPSQAPAGRGGVGQGGTNATGQIGASEPLKWPNMTPPEHLRGPDNRLAEVTADYNKKTGKLTITDDQTGERVVVDVESGRKPEGDPIPDGDYEILEQARSGEYRLDAVDSSPRNDVHEPTGRDEFRLHGPGNTLGCIACKDWKGWMQIKKLIGKTRTSTVRDHATPWWKPFTRETIKKFGKLRVH